MNGWTGTILRVDLSKNQITTADTSKYVPKFIGGIGIAQRIAWEEIPRGTKAFDENNLLIITNGPVTGTLAPGGGKGAVSGVGAQQLPEMFSTSSVGGFFTTELKFAGYDAVVIKGKAAAPCYLLIEDDKVEIKEAGRIWGLGTYDTQKELKKMYGPRVQTLCIGPAGENLVRLAIMTTDTESAAAQGGFGAVAGWKNLKAICVKGSGSVKVAKPADLVKIQEEWLTVTKPAKKPWVSSGSWSHDGHKYDNVPYRRLAISGCWGCNRSCHPMFQDVPRVTRTGFHSNQWGCIGPMTATWQTPAGMDWPLYKLGVEAGFEMTELINDYGLNEWELLGGMIIWIAQANAVGVLTDSRFGTHIDLNDPYFWRDLLHMITYREGFGDLLAEGTTRAINTLGKNEFGETMYRGKRIWAKGSSRVPDGGPQVDTPISLQHSWGFAGHDCGREIHPHVFYPDWIIRALMWMSNSRDPQSMSHVKSCTAWNDEYRKAPNPYFSPRLPAVAIFNEHRAQIKDSMTGCDSIHPRVGGAQQNIEARTFSAVTGIEKSEEEFDKMAERQYNQFRALLMRNNDRDREMELKEIMPWYRRPDSMGIPINEADFMVTVDNYLDQRGWDKKTGWPTRATLEKLDLKDVADELAKINKLPA